MKLKAKLYLTTLIIPIVLVISLFFLPYPIIGIVLLLLNFYIGDKIICPGCHIKISEFYRPFSKYFKGFHLGFHIGFPDKCPHCGCDWE